MMRDLLMCVGGERDENSSDKKKTPEMDSER